MTPDDANWPHKNRTVPIPGGYRCTCFGYGKTRKTQCKPKVPLPLDFFRRPLSEQSLLPLGQRTARQGNPNVSSTPAQLAPTWIRSGQREDGFPCDQRRSLNLITHTNHWTHIFISGVWSSYWLKPPWTCYGGCDTLAAIMEVIIRGREGERQASIRALLLAAMEHVRYVHHPSVFNLPPNTC